MKGAAILLADPYISHQYSGERVGGGVPDAPFSYYTNLPDKLKFDAPLIFLAPKKIARCIENPSVSPYGLPPPFRQGRLFGATPTKVPLA